MFDTIKMLLEVLAIIGNIVVIVLVLKNWKEDKKKDK